MRYFIVGFAVGEKFQMLRFHTDHPGDLATIVQEALLSKGFNLEGEVIALEASSEKEASKAYNLAKDKMALNWKKGRIEVKS